jgi:ABC-type transport system involved in Fe-S cluster assembly fused permease/ATPase subunit
MYILISVLFHSPELKAIEKEVEVVLKFPEAEALSPPILQINEVSFGYSPDRMIFSNVNLGATLESRICIVSSFFNFSIVVCLFPFLYFIILNVHKTGSLY